jgi:hypothetical protein
MVALLPDYDGPTINGRPILSVAEVQKWFLNEGCKIPVNDAASIAAKFGY